METDLHFHTAYFRFIIQYVLSKMRGFLRFLSDNKNVLPAGHRSRKDEDLDEFLKVLKVRSFISMLLLFLGAHLCSP